MSPAFFTAIAEHLFPRRWWLFAASVMAIAFVVAVLFMAPPHLTFLAGTLAGPAIAVPWTLLCACAWFHPHSGNLQPQSKLVGRLPPPLQIGVRWYAAVVLGLFLVFGAVVWPILSVAWQ